MTTELDREALFDIPDPYAASEWTDAVVPRVDELPPAPTRMQLRATRVLAVAVAAACDIALVMAMGLRGGKAGITPGVVLLGVGLPLLGAAGAVAVAQSSASRRNTVMGSIAIAYLVFTATALATRGPGSVSAEAMVRCMVVGAGLSAVPVLVSILCMRRAFATAIRSRSAAIGVASGLLAAAATRMHCGDDALLHVLLGHGAPVVVAMVATVAWGARRMRS
jgi:hypothetical protein